MSKLLYGVGNYDMKGYSRSHAYNVWIGMIRRCYDSDFQDKHAPTYKGCEVDEDFKTFSKFLNFYTETYTEQQQGFVLDEDILYDSNKVYSRYTARFVPREINQLFALPKLDDNLEGNTKRYGVRMISKECFEGSIIIDGVTHKEYFGHPWLAHKYWQQKKAEQILLLADKYQDYIMPDVFQSLLNRAEKILKYSIELRTTTKI